MKDGKPLIAMELDFENKNEEQLKKEVDQRLEELFRIEEEEILEKFKEGIIRDAILFSIKEEKERLRGEFYKQVELELGRGDIGGVDSDSNNEPE